MSSVRPLVVLHIPKTAGIAVSHALVLAEKPSRVWFGFDRAFFGQFDDFASVAAENRSFIHLSPDTLPRDEPLVRAHMSFSTLSTAYPTGRFLTVLREPFCRILSHYVFWRGFTVQQDAAWGGWAKYSGLARRPLEDFLSAIEIACQIDNIVTRLLLWPHELIPDNGMIEPRHDAALIREALSKLAQFDFADVLENPHFNTNLARWLGTSPERPKLNESPALPRNLCTNLDRELTPRAQLLLTARSRLDLALWHHLLAMGAPDIDANTIRATTILRGTARVAALLAGVTEPSQRTG